MHGSIHSDQQDNADIKLILDVHDAECGCDRLWCNKYWCLLTGHRCVSLGYMPLLSIVLKQTLSPKQVRITKQSNSDKSAMQLDQRKQQQWQLYMASTAATTLVVWLERGNTASGMHFKLKMILLPQHWFLSAQPSSSVKHILQQLTSHLWPENSYHKHG